VLIRLLKRRHPKCKPAALLHHRFKRHLLSVNAQSKLRQRQLKKKLGAARTKSIWSVVPFQAASSMIGSGPNANLIGSHYTTEAGGVFQSSASDRSLIAWRRSCTPRSDLGTQSKETIMPETQAAVYSHARWIKQALKISRSRLSTNPRRQLLQLRSEIDHHSDRSFLPPLNWWRFP
jgi:hypothetical protein